MTDDAEILAARLLAASPLAMSIADVRAHIQDRRRKLLAAPPLPERDIAAPEPIPLVDDASIYAREFSERQNSRSNDPPPKPKRKPRGRRAVGDLTDKHDHLRVIDGDKRT